MRLRFVVHALAVVLTLSGCQQDPPTIKTISPNSGPLQGGTGVSIGGSNFDKQAQVFIGGQPCTNVAFNGTGALTASSPAGVALGAVDVTVKNSDGQRAHAKKAFTYSNQAAASVAVSSIAPSTGAAGTPVTITGSGFQAGATVKFGTVAAANVVVTNATTITCSAPTGPTGATDVSVTNPDSSGATLPGGFTYPGGTTPTGKTITTVAGNGTPGFAGDGALATAATLNQPQGVAINAPDNSIFIADSSNHRIRRVDASGNMSTVAGTGVAGFAGDNGPPLSAQLSNPQGIATDGAGNLYIADTGNHAIRLLTGTTTLTTIAGKLGMVGSTGDAGPANAALLSGPEAVAFAPGPSVFIADTGNARVRKVSGGNIAAFAGTGSIGFSGDNAAATAATLSGPAGVVVDGSGNVFIADTGNARVRKVDTANVITTFAGGGTAGAGDGGLATAAQLTTPVGLAIDPAGSVIIVDSGGQRVRSVASGSFTITTLAGTGSQGSTGDSGPAASALLAGPRAVAASAAGAYYIADAGNSRIRKVQ